MKITLTLIIIMIALTACTTPSSQLIEGQKSLGEIIDSSNLENPATAERPLTISRTVNLQSGKTAEIKVGFFNTGTAAVDAKVLSYNKEDISQNLICVFETGETQEFSITSPQTTVAANENTGFQVVIEDSFTAQTGMYSCNIGIVEGANLLQKGSFIIKAVA
jgi:hypothetical protein